MNRIKFQVLSYLLTLFRALAHETEMELMDMAMAGKA